MSYQTIQASTIADLANCVAEMFPDLKLPKHSDFEEALGDMIAFAGLPDFDWDIEMELQEQYLSEQ